MAIRMTFHAVTGKDDEAIIYGQIGEAVVVADGTVSDPVLQTGIYRMVAVGESLVRIGPDDLEDADGGEDWPDRTVELRRIIRGQVVAVGAGA